MWHWFTSSSPLKKDEEYFDDTCTTCGGSGKIDCTVCTGEEWVGKSGKCPVCKDKQQVTCPSCKGKQ